MPVSDCCHSSYFYFWSMLSGDLSLICVFCHATVCIRGNQLSFGRLSPKSHTLSCTQWILWRLHNGMTFSSRFITSHVYIVMKWVDDLFWKHFTIQETSMHFWHQWIILLFLTSGKSNHLESRMWPLYCSQIPLGPFTLSINIYAGVFVSNRSNGNKM